MTKRKRGRPQGGKTPEPIREYWRNIQRAYREAQKQADSMTLRKGRKRK